MKRLICLLIKNCTWDGKVERELNYTIQKLAVVPELNEYLNSIKSIELRHFKDSSLLGSYIPPQKKIVIYTNNIKSIERAIFVFLHEFAHHIFVTSNNFDSSYNENIRNSDYLREEIKADSLALLLLNKYFSDYHIKKVVKIITKGIECMEEQLKEISNQWVCRWNYNFATYSTNSSVTCTIHWMNVRNEVVSTENYVL